MITLDRTSLLVEATAEETLRAIEAALAPSLTLDVPIDDTTIADFVARGMPGARATFLDPADHLVAGLVAKTNAGRRILLRPSPRRSVGPDLVALVFGARARLARLERVWLRVFEGPRPRRPLPFDVDPPMTKAEEELFAAIARSV